MDARSSSFAVRAAVESDAEALRGLITRSFRALAQSHYDSETIAAALEGGVIRLDLGLVEDGTYFVVERAGEIVACGGYSTRLPTIAGESLSVPAEVRAMFVAPDQAGLGLGSTLLRHVEGELVKLGHEQGHLVATLSGVAFYERRGYTSAGEHVIELSGGRQFPLLRMRRHLR